MGVGVESDLLVVLQGQYAYKFVVDDEWRYAPDQVQCNTGQSTISIVSLCLPLYQPTKSDVEGRVSNFIDVSDFSPYMGDNNFFDRSKGMPCPRHTSLGAVS